MEEEEEEEEERFSQVRRRVRPSRAESGYREQASQFCDPCNGRTLFMPSSQRLEPFHHAHEDAESVLEVADACELVVGVVRVLHPVADLRQAAMRRTTTTPGREQDRAAVRTVCRS